MKLLLVERDDSQAWYRTADGKFDVLGEDINLRNDAVWYWRRAQLTRLGAGGFHEGRFFHTRARCLADLELSITNGAA